MMKKTLSLVLALALCLGLAAPAVAVDEMYTLSDQLIGEQAYMPDALGVSSKELTVTPVQQSTTYYCGPACAVMAASTLGLGTYTQPAMANIIGCTTAGSSSSGIARGLNGLLSAASDSRRYVVRNTSSYSIVQSITNSISNGAPVIVSVSQMPDYTTNEGHFIIITGFYIRDPNGEIMSYGPITTDAVKDAVDATATVRFTYIDCHYNNRYFGVHTIDYEDLLTACNSNAGNFVCLT